MDLQEAEAEAEEEAHPHRRRDLESKLGFDLFSERETRLGFRNGEPPYYVGLRKVAEDPYDELGNPDGVIQLGLDENTLALDLVREWLMNAKDAILGGEELGISGIACYQPSDGLMELKLAVAGFMSKAVGNSVTYNPSQIVLTAGVTPAIEILSFCLADSGNTFIVPAPYYPGLDRDVKWRT